ncbi:hypothetical protein [Diaphorobacter aerolatus]|uniref:Lipoprotein n=1 Tax=Diaphorobacter aerolatus TaxID=1288495 RepID=A0A7H0GKV3_9BURK|nr:hypothetical protein [Diaphorobacter aerolatus]QNP48919.1 hypothetical protein H9K75_01575 [Diaphorobacter aerolatus]
MKYFVLLISCGLVGCASSPVAKPELDPAGYAGIASSYVAIPRCETSLKITAEQGSLARSAVNEQLSTYTYDPIRLQTHIDSISKSSPGVPEWKCSELAAKAAAYSQHKNSEAVRIKAQRNNNNNQPDYSIPRAQSTYCNKIGTQVFCNTF